MKTRTLGHTAIQVSEIGFGAWGIGGTDGGHVAYGTTDDDESRAALRRAFDLGITFFDTADFYGFGHSEELIGEVLNDVRDRIVIATKSGMVDKAGTRDFSPGHLRASLEGSLERLRTDYVDLYQLHSPPIGVLERDGEDIIATLEALKTEGKIRAYGNSLDRTEDGLASIEHFGFPCIQLNFNLMDQRAVDGGLLSRCEEREVGVIVRTPLSFGFLTGSVQPTADFGELDHRRRWSKEQIERWAEAHKLFTQLIEGTPGQSPAQFALRYVLSHQATSTAIPGMLHVHEVADNVAASDLGPLDESEMRRIGEIYEAHEFFVRQ